MGDDHADAAPARPDHRQARLADDLHAVGLAAGLDAVGFTDASAFAGARRALEDRRAEGLHGGMQFTYRNPTRSTDPSRLLAGARSLVVGARGYLRQSSDGAGGGVEGGGVERRVEGGVEGGGESLESHKTTGRRGDVDVAGSVPARIARYSWVDHYAPLRSALEAVAGRLREDGWRAVVVADDNALVDRAAAYRAGLGWYGRNTMILLPGAGSWFVLGSVVTDAPLPGAGASVPDGCGTCRRCAVACPTGALDRPGVLDARRCLAWLVQAPGVFPVEHRVALGDRMYGCDECQEVCPVNRLGSRRRPPPPPEGDASASVDALEVLASSDEALLARWGRWYIPERNPVYLRRNALLVLGNAGDPASAAVHDAVGAALRHPHPIVRAHAVWAARRLGFTHLQHEIGTDTDPLVRAEGDPERPVPVRASGVRRPTVTG